MPIYFRCSSCNAALKAPSKDVGRRKPCPQCGQLNSIPESEAPAVAAETVAPPRDCAPRQPGNEAFERATNLRIFAQLLTLLTWLVGLLSIAGWSVVATSGAWHADAGVMIGLLIGVGVSFVTGLTLASAAGVLADVSVRLHGPSKTEPEAVADE